ncbi:hypothetical protein CRYUN_Cryun07bG0046300 [Craigia yunnanensis]
MACCGMSLAVICMNAPHIAAHPCHVTAHRSLKFDGEIDRAVAVFSEALGKGLKPNIIMYNSLIEGLSLQGLILQALQLMNEIYDVTPDVITYNSVLNGLCKTSKSEDVMETFKALTEKVCIPNVITYNILVESLRKARKVNEAVNLLEEIGKKGLAPDIVSFGTLIHGFCNNGDLDGAYRLFRRMEQRYKLFHEMVKMAVPDGYTYRIMIDGFCKTGKVDFGYDFLLEKVKKGLIPSLTTFGRVINCLCVENRVHNAVGLIHLMVGKSIVPEVVNTIFESDKKDVAAPKIVVEDLLKKGHITYYAYDLLHDGVRDKKLLKKLQSR